MLNLKSSTPNVMVYGETGRYPLLNKYFYKNDMVLGEIDIWK